MISYHFLFYTLPLLKVAHYHLACVPFRWRLTLCMRVLLPLGQAGKPRRLFSFRDSMTRLWHSLPTLRARLAVALRNVRFPTAANLSRVGLLSHWVSITCFFILSFVSSCSGSWRDVPETRPVYYPKTRGYMRFFFTYELHRREHRREKWGLTHAKKGKGIYAVPVFGRFYLLSFPSYKSLPIILQVP